MFAIKIVQPIILSNLEKARFIPSSLWLMFAMSESPKFRQITKIQISYRKKERSVGIAKHSIIPLSRNVRFRCPECKQGLCYIVKNRPFGHCRRWNNFRIWSGNTLELKKKHTYTGGDGALLSHDPKNFRLLCTPSEGYRSSGASLSIWSTQYDSVLNNDENWRKKKHRMGGD